MNLHDIHVLEGNTSALEHASARLGEFLAVENAKKNGDFSHEMAMQLTEEVRRISKQISENRAEMARAWGKLLLVDGGYYSIEELENLVKIAKSRQKESVAREKMMKQGAPK